MSDVQAIGAVAEDRIAVAPKWKLVWWRFRRHHLALVSAGLMICLYLVVLCPDFFATQSPEQTDARQAFIPVQTLHFLDDGWNPWVPAIAGKRNPVTLRMEWTTDPQRNYLLCRNPQDAALRRYMTCLTKLPHIVHRPPSNQLPQTGKPYTAF